MAKEEAALARRRKHSGNPSGGQRYGGRRAQRGESPSGTPPSSDSAHSHPKTTDDLRRARLDYLEKTPEERRKISMKYVGEIVQKEPSISAQVKKAASKRRPTVTSESGRRRHRKARATKRSVDDLEYVYVQSQRTRSDCKGKPTSRTPILPTVLEEDASQEPQDKKKAKRRHTDDHNFERDSSLDTDSTASSTSDSRRRSQKRESDSIWRLGVPPQQSSSPQRQHTSIPKRSPSTHGSVYSSRPSVRRSSTSLQTRNESVARIPPKRSLSTSSVVTRSEKKPTGIFATFLKGPGQLPSPTEKKVTCLTCLDDIPLSKSARLACSHRMCHTCLKRVFTMSVTDPAHMPPKCCTSDHIPLKHVDKLFDQKFKVTWNRKFQEYTTRNRIYCPSKGCGEWIKPNHITVEQGRKVGKCKKCGVKVCGTCNNRMHTSKECPKDEATKQFVEVAKKEGWQRCYNCKAMVELKEGCNHMTCRCTAEFCMICGNKWKTCDCPWFNYDAVEADRLLHMNIPQARRMYADGGGRAPIRYQEEMDRRREQEQRDEALARRMEVLGLDEAPNLDGHGNQPQETIAIGNAGGHFLNDDFRQVVANLLSVNINQVTHQMTAGLLNGAITGRENPLLPGPFEVQPFQPNETPMNQPARLRRPHTTTNHAYNQATSTRPNERVVPGRRATDYAAEAARHRPPSRHRPPPVPPPQILEETIPTPPAPARRASTRNSARAMASSQRRASAMAEMVTTDQVSADQRGNRIENWIQGVPDGEPGPGPALGQESD